MGRSTTPLVVGLCTGIVLLAASSSSAAEHGMNEKALSQIPKNLQEIVDRKQSTGMVTLVARNGKIACIDAVGWRIMNKEPLETTDVFWAASITKSFVAVAVMMMVDEGHLQLDDLVEQHIPEFKGQKVKTGKKSSDTAKHPLTVRNLLNHLDGLPKNPTRSRATKSIKERVLKAAKDTLMWEPGTKWNYGGEGLYVLQVAAPGPVQVTDWTGRRFPLHTIAAGQAFMASWTDEQVAEYAADGLAGFTDRTVTTLVGLRQKVGEVRRTGVAWTVGEFSEEITGVAAPVRDADGEPVASVSVYGPGWRFPGDGDVSEIERLVRETAERVGGLLAG